MRITYEDAIRAAARARRHDGADDAPIAELAAEMRGELPIATLVDELKDASERNQRIRALQLARAIVARLENGMGPFVVR